MASLELKSNMWSCSSLSHALSVVDPKNGIPNDPEQLKSLMEERLVNLMGLSVIWSTRHHKRYLILLHWFYWGLGHIVVFNIGSWHWFCVGYIYKPVPFPVGFETESRECTTRACTSRNITCSDPRKSQRRRSSTSTTFRDRD